MQKTIKIILGILGAIVAILLLVYVILCAYLLISSKMSWRKYDDISEYALHRSEEDEKFYKVFYKNSPADSIWPKEIREDMDVKEYKLVYYNPGDSNFLGYMSVAYGEEEYSQEIHRLEQYKSTDYIGVYGATGFEKYDVVAMYAGEGELTYAITDNQSRIIYVFLKFPGDMDIDYTKYIPIEYTPDHLQIR